MQQRDTPPAEPRHPNPRRSGRTLADAIRTARADIGLSTRQLAAAVGVHHSFVSRLETGENTTVRPDLLHRLARTLEIDVADLFALAGIQAPETLPAFAPYLRAKYEMSDAAAAELAQHFDYIANRYDIREKEPPAA